MRRLLVVGADGQRSGAFVAWARAGHHVTLVDGVSASRYEHLADEFVAADPRDESCDLDRLVPLARSADGVTTLSDQSQLTAARLAEEAGLPGPGVHAARLARSKVEQRKAVAPGGALAVPAWSAVRSPEDLEVFFRRSAGPAVLKPADAAASTAVFRVADAAEAARRWVEVRRFSPSATGIVEELVSGPEVSVEVVVAGGRCHSLSVTRKRSGGPTGFLELAHVVSADEPEELLAQARQAAAELVAAWRVGSGVLHLELKPRAEGWVLIEAAARPAGDLIPELVRQVHGRDLYLLQARLALGEQLDAGGPGGSRHAAARFLAARGVVRRSVPPVEVLAGLGDVKMAGQLAQPGRRLAAPVANWGRAGYALGWGPDRERLLGELDRAVLELAEAMGVEPVEAPA